MNKEKLLFYIPPHLIDKELDHIPLLFPFWGIPTMESTPYNKALFSKYNFDINYYGLVDDINICDFILMPYRYNVLLKKHPEMISKYISFAHKHKKPILIDGTGDIEYPIKEKNVYVLRVGGYRFKAGPNDISIPFYADDLLEAFYNGELTIKEKSIIPVIGFAGWAHFSSLQYIRSYIKGFPYRIFILFGT